MFVETFQDPNTLHALYLTAQIALATLVIHLILGLALGYALAQPKWFGRSFLDLIVTLPLVFPPVATGFLLLMILGRHGLLGGWLNEQWGLELLLSFMGVLIAATVSGLPLVVKPVQSALEALPERLSEAARVLGKNELTIFLRVQLPNIGPALLAGLVLSVGRSLGEVGITLMLGGNISGRTATVSLEIYNAVSAGDFERAAVLSGILGMVSLGLFALLKWVQKSRMTYQTT